MIYTTEETHANISLINHGLWMDYKQSEAEQPSSQFEGSMHMD